MRFANLGFVGVFTYALSCNWFMVHQFRSLIFHGVAFKEHASIRTAVQGSVKKDTALIDTTILVTSSLIPSHPSIHLLNETLQSLRFLEGLPSNSPIVIAIDGWDNETSNQLDHDRLNQYVLELKQSAHGQLDHVTVVLAPEHLHILGNIQFGLTYVHTKYVYVIQHDFPFARPIQHTALIKTMEEYSDMVQIVRFNKRKNIQFSIDSGECFNRSYPVSHINGIHLTKTSGWSDNNHLTTKAYYQDVVIKTTLEFPGHKNGLHVPPELIMMQFASKNCSHYGPFLYGPPDDGPYLEHLDGRKTIIKNTASDQQQMAVLHNSDSQFSVNHNSRDPLMFGNETFDVATSILIVSSLIPSHPSFHLLSETIHSLRFLKGLPRNSPIVVAIDGWNGENRSDYDRLNQYVLELKQSAHGQLDHVTVVLAPEHLHILGNIQFGLTYVHTKYVYVIQHDFPFARPIQHTALIKTMEEYSDMVQIVRFNKRKNIQFSIDSGECFNRSYPVSHINGIHLTKTPGWSDNNHLTTKAYYLDIVIKPRLESKKGLHIPPEWVMMNLAKLNCSFYGPFLYGPPGDAPYLKHLDGRKAIAKDNTSQRKIGVSPSSSSQPLPSSSSIGSMLIQNENSVIDTSILITSSLIPSHPSFHLLNETLHSLKFLEGLPPNSPIVISIDGWDGTGSHSNRDRLKQYAHDLKQSAQGRLDHLTVIQAPEHLQILGNIQFGLTYVHTKYVYVIQHDFPFAKPIQHTALIKTMEEYSDIVQIVRFNKRRNKAVSIDRGECFNRSYPVSHINGIHLTKTPGWSDNNHLTTKAYYQDIVIKRALELHPTWDSSMALHRPPEGVMAPLALERCPRWGPFLYGPPGGGPYLKHLNGRHVMA